MHNLDMELLSETEKATCMAYGSEKRRLEFYYTRKLWREFGDGEKVKYSKSGKPIIDNGYLSISHSHNCIAIAYSAQYELGLDIEPVSEKINKVRHKFLHPKETFIDLKNLTKAWCIKEAVYKLMDMDDVFFMDNIYLDSVQNDQFAIIDIAGIEIKPQFKIMELKNDMMLAWAFHPHPELKI
ncbi:hypothetical protein DNU06_12370 [Putridiphycobacter roseus]|uniref:4'-phosphopantetheinyl transferase domain-containing protein n=2 Tax=Putridiphycobacter roseus TaxID=2219161 RepID=A0A2W1NC37_9FLAO|nr:hypothetical protein DNU06_12370 [Putridiphycobacter roseus]